MSHQRRVVSLVEGAFFALITAIMGALAIYFLPVKFLLDFLWGIPIIIIILRYDLRTGILTLITTAFITVVMTEPVSALLLVTELAPLALAYGLLFKRGATSGTVLLSGAVVSIISTGLTVLAFSIIADINIIPTEQALRMQAEQSMELYRNFGLLEMQDQQQMIDTTVKLMTVLIPSALAIASVIRAFLTYWVAAGVLRRFGYVIPYLPPFNEWRLPWYSVWVLITGLGMSLLGDQFNIYNLAVAGKNIVFVVLPVFFIIGLSVLYDFFKSWNIPRWFKIFLVVISIINIGGTIILCMLIGLFDPLVSFRRWKKPKDQ